MNTTFQDRLFEPHLGWIALAGAALAMLLLAILARAVIDHPPLYDELLHMLAARGVLETGEPRIGDGMYGRAEWFTRSVALSYGLFGESEAAARFPALVSALLLVGAVVLWTSARAGWIAGMTAGMALAIMPATVELSVFSRFYTMHALAVFVAAVAAFEAMQPGRSVRTLGLCGITFVLAILLARHLQVTTTIAFAGIFSACVSVAFYDRHERLVPLMRRHVWATTAVIVTSLAAILAILSIGGFADRLQGVPLWAADRAGRWDFYNQRLGRALPLLWPLFPLAIVAALLRHRRIAIFCVALFVVAFFIHSIAAQKAVRYLYYALPFLCVLLGVGFSVAVQAAQDALRARIEAGHTLVLPALLAFAVVTFGISQEGQLTMRWLTAKGSSLDAISAYAKEASWDTGVMPQLGEYAATADQVVASAGVKALYYLDRYDYEINASVVEETDTAREFGLDLRTGRRVIGRAESLTQVIAEPGVTLVVVDDDKLGRWNGVPADAVKLLEDHCRDLGLPADQWVHAWVCDARLAAE